MNLSLAIGVARAQVAAVHTPELAAAYFVVAEAVANALKHGAPSRIDIRLSHCDGRLLVQVRDDGQGGAAFRPDGGLEGLADRLAVLGGRLELDSSSQAGTRIEAVLPCA